MLLNLALSPSYRFDAMIEAHGWPQLSPFSWDSETHTLRRIEQLSDGRVVALTITATDTMLQIDVDGAELDTSHIAEIEARVRWMLELDEDFAEFYCFCAEHPPLQHVEPRGLGPMLRSPTVWEDYVKTVFTTNTTWAQTKGMVGRVVDVFGAPHASGEHAFPSAHAIATTSADAFAAAVRAGYRAPYIHATACDIADGRLDLEGFKMRARELETARLIAELRKLRGVGPYAAAHLALLLGSYGAVPIDSWARSLVRTYIAGGEPVSDRDVHAHFVSFGRWQALAFRCWNWEG